VYRKLRTYIQGQPSYNWADFARFTIHWILGLLL